jgi:F420-dependent oxidoreductase-like protein
MRYALMIEPQQGLSYPDQLAIAQRAEAGGFDALFRSDHYDSFPGAIGRPTTDAWTVVAGLARDTSRIHLGVLVSPVTFRHPGLFAKIVATAQEMSGGRIESGLGAGWNEGEHRHHGFPFPEIGERADMMEETLAILRGLWQEPDGWSFTGAHWSIAEGLFRAKPEPVPPLIIGGEGSPRSMRIAAQWADEFNLSSSTPQKATAKFAELDGVVAAAGRDPRSIRHSAMVGVLIGRDEADLAAREAALLSQFGLHDPAEAAAWLEARKPRWIYGLPDAARAQAAAFAAADLDRIMLQDFLPWDLDHIDLIAETLIGA